MSSSVSVEALAGRASAMSLVRFDGKNFPMWKVRMRALLQSQDLWEVVEKAHDGASSSNSKKAIEEEESRDGGRRTENGVTLSVLE